MESVAPARVEARGWGWRHAGRKRWAFSDLTLAIEAGERVLLLGPSGSGKSTLLAALAGIGGGAEEGEQLGELLLDGMSASGVRGRAGLVLQDPDSQVILARVGDDVAFGCENLGVPRDEIWRRVGEALDDVGLRLPLSHPSSALSGGQKQRLALAGALAMRPGLLLLDEPTANLDPAGAVQLGDAVARSLDRSGATLIVVEHRVEVWQHLVDRVIVLDADGRLLADGRPAEVFERHAAALADAGVWIPGSDPAPAASVRARRMPAARPLLAARGLAIGRSSGPGTGPVAQGLALELEAGASTVLIGPNGAGKSTLALTLGGLLAPLAGELETSEELRAGASAAGPHRWRSRELLTRIGTVFQEPEHLFVARTAREEIAVGLHALKLPAPEIAARVDELLARLRLDRLALANPFTLSGGEKRRLSVAAVLAARPRLLILDEPTFGQDRATWLELTGILRRLVDDGGTVLSVTHDPAFVAVLGDRVLELDGAVHERTAAR